MKFEEIPVFPVSIPAMRAVELLPAEIEGQRVLVVRDPLGVIEGAPVMRPHPLLLVFVQLADGLTKLEDMASAVKEATGEEIPVSVFESIAQQLDDALMLQSERFRDALVRKRDAFVNAPVRHSTIMRVDPEDRLDALKELGAEFRRHWTSEGAPPAALDLVKGTVVGILAPHIDYQRGGPAYAWSYRALGEYGADASTLIVLGTNHHPSSHRFIATRKAFETPLGVVQTDGDVLDALAAEFGGELFEDEYAHANEHTIELQTVYLRQIFGDATPRIVPILVGTFEDVLNNGGAPREHEDISAFCAALRKVIHESNGRVGIIGSVDLSHCGPQFGDEQENDDARVKEIADLDRHWLDAIEAGDPDAFFQAFRPDFNATSVCSIGAIYCVMEAMRGYASPKLLTYQQANSEDGSCLVSFCSFAFVREK